MTESLTQLLSGFGLSPNALIIAGIGIGALSVFATLTLVLTAGDPVADRMRASAAILQGRHRQQTLKKRTEDTPRGIYKAFVPDDADTVSRIRLQLAQAGFDGDHAVRDFFVLRLTLALALPLLCLAGYALNSLIGLPPGLLDWIEAQGKLRILQILSVAVAAGFYGPGYWLAHRVRTRQRRIEDAFPNTLDLLQISVEAGMGFDAALTRVSRELARVSPEISDEFLLVQNEIGAGRDRQEALSDMATRMGIEEARSFVHVITQSLQYGTSIAAALTTYSADMRESRELRAQEKANKLPVQMSAVMAFLMLPALFLITLGPTVIRYMHLYN